MVNIRARRVAPGVPVAFLVKAIAGTYRRYLPEIEDVCLTEYDPGESIPTAPSNTFEPVFNHKPGGVGLSAVGLPVLELSSLDRRQSVLALESFFRVWSNKSAVLGVEGLEEGAPLRAATKWAAVYEKDYHQLVKVSERRWNIIVKNDSDRVQQDLEKEEERMPGKIFLLLEDQE